MRNLTASGLQSMQVDQDSQADHLNHSCLTVTSHVQGDFSAVLWHQNESTTKTQQRAAMPYNREVRREYPGHQQPPEDKILKLQAC